MSDFLMHIYVSLFTGGMRNEEKAKNKPYLMVRGRSVPFCRVFMYVDVMYTHVIYTDVIYTDVIYIDANYIDYRRNLRQ